MDRRRLFAEKLGGMCAVVHKRENMFWLTGYTGEGCVFVGRDGATVIVTDFRYTEQASQQAPSSACEATSYDRTETDILKKLTDGYDKVAVETDHLTFDAYTRLSSALSGRTLVPQKGMLEELRMIKDEGELALIARAAAISCRAYENILGIVKPGMTEKQLQVALDHEMLLLGADGLAFSTIAAAGEHGSLPHAIPSDRPIGRGELVTLDFGAKCGCYCSDMTRTFAVGRIDDDLRRMYEDVRTAQNTAFELVKAGACCRDVDKAARDYLDERYPGCFGHGLGHSVGLMIHESPRFSTKDATILRAGMTMTVEPGVYIPGRGGCRIEDTVFITEDGFTNPYTAPKQLIEL